MSQIAERKRPTQDMIRENRILQILAFTDPFETCVDAINRLLNLLERLRTGFPDPKRTYKALEFVLDRAWDDRLELNASYTLSYSKGNAEGPVTSDFAFADSGRTEAFGTSWRQLRRGRVSAQRSPPSVHTARQLQVSLELSESRKGNTGSTQ